MARLSGTGLRRKARTGMETLANSLQPCRGLPGVGDFQVEAANDVVEFTPIEDLNTLKQSFAAAAAIVRLFGRIVDFAPDMNDLEVLTGLIVKALRSSAAQRFHRLFH
ncbi:MAG: hypothetical protein ACLPID_19780 [Beijerinckiaceae bacterium]